MNSKIKQLYASTLISGSFVMIVGGNAVNFINYIYHLMVGRLLTPAEYGELAALFSLLGLLTMIPVSFGIVVVKFVSSAKSGDEVKNLVSWLNRLVKIVSILMLVITITAAPFIGDFLNLENMLLVIIAGSTVIFSLPAFFNRSILQGLLLFKQNVSSILGENLVKLVVGVFLIYIGFDVLGASIGVFISALVGWFLSNRYLKKYLTNQKPKTPHLKPMVLYSIPVILNTITLTSLTSTDLVLIKHFLSPQDAGLYAALSTLGKIIFFGAGPIASVMFPLVTKKQVSGDSYKKVFFYSLIMTALLASGVLLVYEFFPAFAIHMLYGSLYTQASDLLIWFGVFVTLYTLSFLVINFHLSLNKTFVVVFPITASIAQGLGLWFFHKNLFEVISVSIYVSGFLFLCLAFYSIKTSYPKINLIKK